VADADTAMMGVDTDDIRFTERILIYKVVMNLCPTESNDFAVFAMDPTSVFRAETRRFELLKAFTPYLVSSEAI